MKKLSIPDRVEVMLGTEACIAIKDQKDEFPKKIVCRLRNPSKSSIG